MALGLTYAQMVENRMLHIEELMKDGNTGYSLPRPYQGIVIDSAASATQIATGQRVRNETLGVDSKGYAIETILEWAEREGLSTGLVTNMRVSHATPASFAAHQASRYVPEPDIVGDILGHDMEVLLGGGARALVPTGHRVSEFLPGIPPDLDQMSNRRDSRNLLEEARSRGYVIVSDREALAQQAGKAGKLLGFFSGTHLPFVVDQRHLGLERVPSLSELTGAALDVVSGSQRGFFLMVEGGRIDYGGHDNDAGAMLHEILEFDEAVGVGLEFQKTHPETLVIVTGDHGTGGFSFTYGDWGDREKITLPGGLVYETDHRYPSRVHLEMLANQRASYQYIVEQAGGSPERLVETVKEFAGLTMTLEEARVALARDSEGRAWTEDFRHFYGDQDYNPACLLGRALARHTYVVWSTGGHTIEPILTFGRGPGAEDLRGVYPNTHLHDVMKAVLGTRGTSDSLD